MPEYIMEYDIDETGKLINARRKEKLTRCKDCGFCVRDECCRVGHVVKSDGYCYEGRSNDT